MSGYRPPSNEPQGKWAHAIHKKRRSDGISQTGAFELLGARLGLGPKSRAAYVAIDMGEREPTEAESKVLAEWLGYYPEDHMAGGSTGDTSQLTPAAYLERIDALVETVRVQNALLIRLLTGPDQGKVADLKQWAAEQLVTTPLPRPNDPALRAER